MVYIKRQFLVKCVANALLIFFTSADYMKGWGSIWWADFWLGLWYFLGFNSALGENTSLFSLITRGFKLCSKMQTAMCFKPNGGIGQLAVSQQSQATLVPWWVGTQPLYGESFGQLKSVAGNCGENQVVAAPRQMNHVMDQRTGQGPAISDEECGDTAKFSIFQGKTSYGSHFLVISSISCFWSSSDGIHDTTIFRIMSS